MKHEYKNLPQILEAALFAAGEPLNLERMSLMFEEAGCPTHLQLREALTELVEFYKDRGVELIEVSSGFRFQSRVVYSRWLKKLWEKKPPRYSRALLETLALVVYRQPITRGEIEDIRGVAVSTNIIKTLLEREWVNVVGQKDVPGKPSLYATTKQFLDYFNLKSLSDLPPLDEIVNFEEIEKRLGEQLSLEIGQEAANDEQVMENEALLDHDGEEDIVDVSTEEEQAVMQRVALIEASLEADNSEGKIEQGVEDSVSEAVGDAVTNNDVAVTDETEVMVEVDEVSEGSLGCHEAAEVVVTEQVTEKQQASES